MITEKVKRNLQASLAETIENWLGDQSETEDWIDGYVGDQLHELMADAAVSVLLCAQGTQDYLKREGMISK